MKYALKEDDKKRVELLNTLGAFILKKLGVEFTAAFLKETIVVAYLGLFELQQQAAEDTGEAVVADRDDPSNLAIVLLEAFKVYHVKSEITEDPTAETAVVLTIAKTPEEKQPPGNLLGIFGSMENDIVHSLQPGKQKRMLSYPKDSIEHFISLKATAFTRQPGYKLTYRKEILQYLALLAAILIAGATIGVAVYKGFQKYDYLTWLPGMLLLCCGIFICYNLFLLDKMNVQDSLLVKKFCVNKQKGMSCQKVISSKGAKIFGIISMTDIGAVYFVTLFLFTVSALLNDQYGSVVQLLFWLAVIPLPYSIFSLYYQFRVLKKVCMLCLLTQLVLWLQFLYVVFINYPKDYFSFDGISLLNFFSIALIVTGMYLLVVKYIVNTKRAAALFLENNKYKMDKDLFEISVKRQPFIEQPQLPGVLILGNPAAATSLTAVLSLSCSPCASMLNDLMKLADWFGDEIGITVLLKTDEAAKELMISLLDRTMNNDHSGASALLKEWYNISSKQKKNGMADMPGSMARWKKLHQTTNSNNETEQVYAAHKKWYGEHFISYTPLLIYKQHFLPDQFYDINVLITILETAAETT